MKAVDKNSGLTWDRLIDVFDIYPETGEVYWRNCPSRKGAALNGNLAGDFTHEFGYVMIVLDYRSYKRHRLVWFSVHKKWPEDELDHRDLNRQNDSIFNLREATKSQNSMNRLAPRHNTSGIKGVCFDGRRQKWRATLRVDGKLYSLGRFNKQSDAKLAYDRAVSELCGEFGRIQ